MHQCGGRVCITTALVSLLLAGLARATSDPFDNQLGDISYCKKQCLTTVINKSFIKDSVLSACNRGCRLYSICKFVNGNAGSNASKEECQGACQEAYTQLLEQEGCRKGCENQPTAAESERRKLKALMRRSKPLSVMDLLSGWCSDIVSSAQSFISSTWTFYLQADDGKVLVFQSQPQMEYSFPELQTPGLEAAEKPWTPVSSSTPRPHTGAKDHGEKTTRGGGKGRRNGQRGDSPPADHDFLGCMSRRSGLPRWILAACLFLSIMVMLWLSCASLVTAPDQRVKTQLSINGDKEFLDDIDKVSPYPLTPVIAVAISQSDEGQEAGPLPVKVDLDKTIL
ncbi:transmembrane protein 59-like [Paramormyrops kingsleyae]|uniref:Transmembrane protein 59-like n=1 Tax=Paramormyrops kingsleyae TaxID=1676925 RepID=A0A3B3S7N3_9TELE|nr:transmembrane protein 59-like [Paramormyrops kingsleyae]